MEISIHDLTDEEIVFLKMHKIDFSEIYDGRGERTGSWKISANDGRYDFVLTGGRTCSVGHRLKTRAGHCIQCKTSNISFIRRENSSAYVYLASAKNGNIIKIGCTRQIFNREKSLRSQAYGGYSDWELVSSFETENAGKIEREISYIFSGNKIYGDYRKNRLIVTADEMFEFDADFALEIFKEIFHNYANAGLDIKISP
jgi:hypothetical protein